MKTAEQEVEWKSYSCQNPPLPSQAKRPVSYLMLASLILSCRHHVQRMQLNHEGSRSYLRDTVHKESFNKCTQFERISQLIQIQIYNSKKRNLKFQNFLTSQRQFLAGQKHFSHTHTHPALCLFSHSHHLSVLQAVRLATSRIRLARNELKLENIDNLQIYFFLTKSKCTIQQI